MFAHSEHHSTADQLVIGSVPHHQRNADSLVGAWPMMSRRSSLAPPRVRTYSKLLAWQRTGSLKGDAGGGEDGAAHTGDMVSEKNRKLWRAPFLVPCD